MLSCGASTMTASLVVMRLLMLMVVMMMMMVVALAMKRVLVAVEPQRRNLALSPVGALFVVASALRLRRLLC